MSTYDYARAKASADRIIERFGAPAALLRPTSTGPVYDPTPGAPIEHPCVAAVIDFTDSEIFDNGGRVLSTDKHVILAKGALAIDPTPSDKLRVGDVEFWIIGGPPAGRGIKTIAPAGVVVFYDLQCRT